VEEAPALRDYDIQYLRQLAAQPEGLGRLLPGASGDAVSDFLRVNTPPPTPNELALPFPYTLLTDKALQEMIGDDLESGWERFDRWYPHASGYWSFSAIGLDCQASQALLFVRHVYGYAGMTGTLFLLWKEDGGWTVQSEYLLSEA
jgi:hypothetical protein